MYTAISGDYFEGVCIVTASNGYVYILDVSSSLVVQKSTDAGVNFSTVSTQTPTNIFGSAGTIAGVAAALDSQGYIHVIVQGMDTTTTRDIAYAKFNTADDTWGAWEQVVALSASSIYVGIPAIAIDSSDKPHVLYNNIVTNMGNDYYVIFYSNKTGASWSAQEQVSVGYVNYSYMDIVVNGTIIEANYRGTSTQKYRTKNGTWGSENTHTYSSSTTTSKWVTFDGSTIYRYGIYGGVVYENNTSTGISVAGFGCSYTNGTRYLVYSVPSDTTIKYVSNSGSGWSAPVTIVDMGATLNNYVVTEWSYLNFNSSSRLSSAFRRSQTPTSMYYTKIDFSYSVSTSKSSYIKGGGGDSSSKSAYIFGVSVILLADGYVGQSGTWKNESGSTSNIWQSIDETTPNDLDYIYDTNPLSGDYYEFTLTNPIKTPGSGEVSVYWRGRDRFNIGTIKSKVELKEGSTIIASSIVVLESEPKTFYFILTPQQRNNITNWNNLSIRITVIPLPITSPTKNATTYLTTPTYDGSNQAVHPSVLYITSGWNNYKYWMGMTPYPNGNSAYENPSILVSNNGTTWVVPSGLTNPVVAAVTPPAYNADAEIMFDKIGNIMYLYYRNTNGVDTDNIRVKSSTNGISWGSPITLVTGGKNIYACPAVLYDGNQYVMWLNNLGGTNPNLLERRTSLTPTGLWSSPTVCNLIGAPATKDFWHLDVNKNGNIYQAFINFCDSGTGGSNTVMYFAQSFDGIDWYVDNYQFLPLGSGTVWDNAMIYRSSGLITTSGYDLFYSAMHDDITWHIGRVNLVMS